MITQVDIRNFKSIRDQTLKDLPPVVGIWGKNGTGKSSFLQAIVWAAKNRGDFIANGLNLDGINIVFGREGKYKCIVKVIDSLPSGKESFQCIIENRHISQVPSNTLTEIRYFPPWRHISKRYFAVQNQVVSDIGYRAETIHTFLHWFLHELMGKEKRGDKEAEKIYERLNYWSEKIGYGKLLDMQISNNVAGTYKDSILNFEIPIVDGGFGGNSFLPIILECYKFKGGIILIEEPEISLHPGAQGDIWEFLIEMVEERNHQIIFTSHSPYLATKIARTLREGKLEDKIHLYLTSKDKEKGTQFKLIPPDEIIQRLHDYWDDILPELRGR